VGEFSSSFVNMCFPCQKQPKVFTPIVVHLFGYHASLITSVILSPFPSKPNKWKFHEHLISVSFFLLTSFINWSNAIVGFVHHFYFRFLFLLAIVVKLLVYLFVGMFLFNFIFCLALPFLLIGFLDSWIYLSVTCLLDYKPIEVLVYYACPFDGVWKFAGESTLH
jgi:hypothetical protein